MLHDSNMKFSALPGVLKICKIEICKCHTEKEKYCISFQNDTFPSYYETTIYFCEVTVSVLKCSSSVTAQCRKGVVNRCIIRTCNLRVMLFTWSFKRRWPDTPKTPQRKYLQKIQVGQMLYFLVLWLRIYLIIMSDLLRNQIIFHVYNKCCYIFTQKFNLICLCSVFLQYFDLPL